MLTVEEGPKVTRPITVLLKELTASALQLENKHEIDKSTPEQYANLKNDWVVDSVKTLLTELPSLMQSERLLIDLLLKKQ
jgi:hypothetical protein